MNLWSKFTKEEKFKISFNRILKNWLINYKGWSVMDALNEVVMIEERVGHDAIINGFDTRLGNIAYVKMSRVGAKKPLNRKKRVELGLLINNAVNHAMYEVEFC